MFKVGQIWKVAGWNHDNDVAEIRLTVQNGDIFKYHYVNEEKKFVVTIGALEEWKRIYGAICIYNPDEEIINDPEYMELLI